MGVGVGSKVAWRETDGDPDSPVVQGKVLEVLGPPVERAVVRLDHRRGRGTTVAVIVGVPRLIEVEEAIPVTNRIQKEELEPVPEGMDLLCYRCKQAGAETPATHYRKLKTPSGGKYNRGWCDSCIEGRPAVGRRVARPMKFGDSPKRSLKPGTPVVVHYDGKILHYVTNDVIILVGTRGYAVPIDFVRRKEGGDVP